MWRLTFYVVAHRRSGYLFGTLIIYDLIWKTVGGRAEVSDHDEKLLYRYFRCKNVLKWVVKKRPVCPTLCPPEHYVVTENIGVEELLLEAPSCARFEAEILHCHCGFRPHGSRWIRGSTHLRFVSGLNGEIYELRRASGMCGDYKTWTISTLVVRNENTSCFDWLFDCLTSPIQLPTLKFGTTGE